jgi:hypothetical protein
LTASGSELVHRKTNEVFWSIRWDDVEEIVAFKVDAIVVDHICLGFRRSGETEFVVADEETPGWQELNDQLSQQFGVAFDQWFEIVAFPAFVENRITLWSRSAGPLPRHATDGSALQPNEHFNSFAVAFDGGVLRRGFWLYVVQVRGAKGTFAYIGRTGDTSSPNAASLFSRITSGV